MNSCIFINLETPIATHLTAWFFTVLCCVNKIIVAKTFVEILSSKVLKIFADNWALFNARNIGGSSSHCSIPFILVPANFNMISLSGWIGWVTTNLCSWILDLEFRCYITKFDWVLVYINTHASIIGGTNTTGFGIVVRAWANLNTTAV